MPYTIEEHKHRFAAWAASRGASTSPKCRFRVELGRLLIENSGLKNAAKSLDNLSDDFDKFDMKHKIWRTEIIRIAKIHDKNKRFTDGVAAKLINLYLKSVCVCSDDINNKKIKAIHPPIDSVLLKGLKSNNIGTNIQIWSDAIKKGWSNFDSNDYQKVIDGIKDYCIPEKLDLWEIEEFWQGNQ